MTRRLLSTLFLYCFAWSAFAAGPADEAAIRKVVADQVTAWNAMDAKAFSERFAREGSFTNIRGDVFYGYQAFLDRHVEIFAGFFKDSRLAMTVRRIRFVRPDVAIVDVETQVSELKGLPPGVRPSADGTIHTRLQQVYVKDRGTWWIESYHNSDVKGS
jgi:uncharacterized protein (TIGR02246 family)